jgi:ABC-2 type transport system permease protein
MRLFWELLALSFKRQFTYRAANYAGLVTNLFFGVLRAAVLIALYGARPEISGISIEGAVTYTGLTQAVIAFLQLFGVNSGLMNAVYSGEIATDLLKPLGLFSFWLAREAGASLVSLLVRGITIMGAYALFFPIVLPRSLVHWAAFLLALALGWLISFSWRFLFNLSAFWTPDARGIARMAFTLSWFLSGFIMPLRFFPEGFRVLCEMTPFPSMVNTVTEVYLGVLTGPELLRALLIQAMWVGVLVTLCHVTLRAGVRRLVIQGG